MTFNKLSVSLGAVLLFALAGCAPVATTPRDAAAGTPQPAVTTGVVGDGSSPSPQRTTVVIRSDYLFPADGSGLADASSVVALGTFEKTIRQRPAKAVNMGSQGYVDVWQFRIETLYKGKPGAVVHIMRWPDDVDAEQYHMTAGQKAVVFLSTLPNSGLYAGVCGDAALLLVGDDGTTLTSPNPQVPGLDTVADVAALFK